MDSSTRSISINGITFSVLSFKNAPIIELNELIESLTQILYEGQSVVIHSIVWADKMVQKTWQNSIDEALDEAKWPSFWIDRPMSKTGFTCTFILVSGTTIKTLVSDHFVTKTIESPFGRMMFGGNLFCGKDKNPEKQVVSIKESMDKATLYSGMTSEHIIQSINIIPADFLIPGFFPDQKLPKPIEFLIETNELSSMDSFIMAINPLENTSIQNSSKQYDQGTVEQTVIENQGATWIEMGIKLSDHKTTHINDQLDWVYQQIENQLTNNQMVWSDLFLGVVYMQQASVLKACKDKFKEKQIPLSSVMFIDNLKLNTNRGYWFYFRFIATK